MKVLLVLPQPPAAEGGAADRCSLGLLAGLRAHGVDVHAISARQHFSTAYTGGGSAGLEVVEVESTPPTMSERLWNVRQPVAELARGTFAELVRERSAGVDVVHLEQVETGRIATAPGRPSALHLHYRVRLDRSWGRPLSTGFRQVLEFHRAEQAALRRHRWLIASSPRVADTLRADAPDAEVVLAPLSLDPAYYPQAPLDGPPIAGLIGLATWAPTADAIDRLLGRVWPIVHPLVPEAALAIAGRGTQHLDGAGVRADQRVRLIGPIDSAVAFLRGLSMLVYPVGRGSGMKVKVLEALALGLPIVTTTEGAEGIDGGDGVIVAQDDRTLAEATAQLLRDPLERRQRGEAARAAFAERYAPAVAAEPLVDLYQRMAADAGATTGGRGPRRR